RRELAAHRRELALRPAAQWRGARAQVRDAAATLDVTDHRDLRAARTRLLQVLLWCRDPAPTGARAARSGSGGGTLCLTSPPWPSWAPGSAVAPGSPRSRRCWLRSSLVRR